MKDRHIITNGALIPALKDVIKSLGVHKALLVCDGALRFLPFFSELELLKIELVKFDAFTPNPQYEQVCEGVRLMNESGCDSIIAIGGGSTIDVAKCIKLYCRLDSKRNYLHQELSDNGIPLVAAPTTAGTGSESTRFAVIYYEGAKQSVAHEAAIPSYALLDSTVLKSLPLYQKKCTMLDALCQSIESFWSVNSDETSLEYSRLALEGIIANWQAYIFENDADAAKEIMLAANYAGRAINVTQTTAAHAMSYKLTSMYALPHGHAVAVCLPEVWSYMLTHTDECIDERGEEYLNSVFRKIAVAMGRASARDAVSYFEHIIRRLEIAAPTTHNKADLDLLAASVNPVRLKNNPIRLSKEVLYGLYSAVIRIE